MLAMHFPERIAARKRFGRKLFDACMRLLSLLHSLKLKAQKEKCCPETLGISTSRWPIVVSRATEHEACYRESIHIHPPTQVWCVSQTLSGHRERTTLFVRGPPSKKRNNGTTGSLGCQKTHVLKRDDDKLTW